MNDTPSPRFTGIFIPAEILEMENLTPLEQMLVSWIDALHSKEYGGCFASNEYLAQKLRVKENTIAKAITNLRQLGLIEDISFNGRHRVIRAKIAEYVEKCQSKAGLDLNPKQGWRKIQGSHGEKSKRIYKEERKEERKERETSKPPDQGPPSPASGGVSEHAFGLVSFFFEKLKEINPKIAKPNLKTWTKELDRIMRIDNRSPEELRQVIEYIINEHKTSTSEFTWSKAVQSPAKLREHFAKIWMQMKKVNPKEFQKQKEKKELNTAKENHKWAEDLRQKLIHKQGSKIENIFTLSDTCVSLKSGHGWVPLGYLEPGFRDQVENFLRKLGVL